MPSLMRVELLDVPGSLGRVASAIGEAGGDIEAIDHDLIVGQHWCTALLGELEAAAVPGAEADFLCDMGWVSFDSCAVGEPARGCAIVPQTTRAL